MAAPLKDSFGAEIAVRLADMVEAVYPAFDRVGFLGAAREGYDELELTARGRHLARVLRPCLPDDVDEALRVIVASLGPPAGEVELEGMESFIYMPFVYFVAEYGLGEFEASMSAQYELTRRFTAEFSIRAFLDLHTEATLARLAVWAGDADHHVRRLVSEGTRPRLPWAPRLRRFQADPAPVLVLLESLKDDPSGYVRRSVANNLNDISKDHPALVVEVAARWMEGATPERRALVRHALRTLVKRGDEGALAVLGFGRGSSVLTTLRLSAGTVEIGAKLAIEIDVENPGAGAEAAAIDLIVHFVKAGGGRRPKVFKGGELSVAPGARATIRRTISFAQHTTRTHYPGTHRAELLVNGETRPGVDFEVVRPAG